MTTLIIIAITFLTISIFLSAYIIYRCTKSDIASNDTYILEQVEIIRRHLQSPSDFEAELQIEFAALNKEDYLKLFLMSGITYFVENRTWRFHNGYLICNPQPYANNKSRQIIIDIASVMSFHVVTANPKPEADDKNEKATVPQNQEQ